MMRGILDNLPKRGHNCKLIMSSGDAAFKLGLTGTTIHLISLHGTILGGHKIRVTDIDATNGQKLDQQTLSDSDVASESDILHVGAGTAVPIVAWTDKSLKAVKVNLLGTKNVVSLPIDKKGEEVQSVKVHAPGGLSALPHFLVHYTSATGHWAEVYHIDLARSTVSKAYDLPRLAGKGAFATSVSEANVFFTRFSDGEISVTSSVSHGILERNAVKEFVPTTFGNPAPAFAVSEVMARPDGTPAAVRAAVLLDSGDWALFLNGELAWSRPEALTLAESVVFTEPAQGERLARELAIEEHATLEKAFVHRLTRHLEELKYLPDWLQQQPAKIVDSILGTSLAQKGDKFGFNKLVVVATRNGRLIALDTGNGGQVAWSQPVPDYTPDAAWQAPTLQASAPGIVRVKTATGHWVFGLDGQILRKGSDAKTKVQDGATVSYNLVDGELSGFASDNQHAPIWTFKPKDGETILSVTARPTEDPVAQIGVVLGDRRVLYKYLNQNLALVVTANEAASSISVTLIDSVSGDVLYEARHPGIDVSRPIPAALSENWLTYSYTLKSGPITSSRGHVLVTAHVFESAVPNDRGALGSAANYSSLNPLDADAGKPYVLSQSFQIPDEISSFAVSHTRQGITSRMLIGVVPATAGIIGIPTQFLDPRRPVGRDPTSQEQMEGLTRYQPVLEFNPQWYLNHKREVVRTKKIVTNPAFLESTSLVFAYGADVFGTRVSPSFAFDVLGRGFNKVQMLLTVAALFVAVVFVAPLVSQMSGPLRRYGDVLILSRLSESRLTCAGPCKDNRYPNRLFFSPIGCMIPSYVQNMRTW
jgi:hypothetical protein